MRKLADLARRGARAELAPLARQDAGLCAEIAEWMREPDRGGAPEGQPVSARFQRLCDGRLRALNIERARLAADRAPLVAAWTRAEARWLVLEKLTSREHEAAKKRFWRKPPGSR